MPCRIENPKLYYLSIHQYRVVQISIVGCIFCLVSVCCRFLFSNFPDLWKTPCVRISLPSLNAVDDFY